jgi:3-methyladenine DNA glycosylase AlkD
MEILKRLANHDVVKGMARFGINPNKTYGVSMPDVRAIAADFRTDHQLALKLWASGIHEARILASLIDDPAEVTEEQMERWANDFDSWDVCDQCCMNLFDKTPFAYEKAVEWSKRNEEFVKRAGFALMAVLAVHDKKAQDSEFISFLSAIRQGARDDRNFVKKSVNWALRQIGKRSIRLNDAAIEAAEDISKMDSSSAKWIASDAIRELTSEDVQKRLRNKKN